jgi:coenzyme F420 hydrogenase subunit beta
LQKYRPYRCHLCPDGTGEFADISCGDPWYRQNESDNPGQSLILVRTKKGEEILKGAISEGYISAEPAAHSILMNSQKNLYGKRAAIWGRLMAFGFLGLPKPRYQGFSLLSSWLTLPPVEKIKSVAGTMRRIIQRKYYRPQIC